MTRTGALSRYKPDDRNIQPILKTAYIYALADPDNPVIPKYIGRTKHHPKRRLYEHMATAFKRGKTPLDKWLMSLDKRNALPGIIIYEVVAKSDAADREQFWTEFFKPLGLFNIKSGDSQPSGADIVFRRKQWMNTDKGKLWLKNVQQSHKPKQPSLLLWAHRQKFKQIRTAGAMKKRRAVFCSETGERFDSMSDAAKHLGVSQQALRDCIIHSWKCKGHYWKFEHEISTTR